MKSYLSHDPTPPKTTSDTDRCANFFFRIPLIHVRKGPENCGFISI